MSKAQTKPRPEAVVTRKEMKASKTDKKVIEDIKLTATQQKSVDGQKTLSAKIRFLNKEGIATAQIARLLKIRYQHARNVLETPLKRKTA